MKCSECQFGAKAEYGWDCKISPYCVNDKDWYEHKCEGCPWGTFTGVSYKCSLPRCMPRLGNFNGVGKNG